MRRLWMFFAALALGWLTYSIKHKTFPFQTFSKAPTPSPSEGFVPILMPDGAAPETVLILAPLNCPSEAAQKADALSARLKAAGIPNQRLAAFDLNLVSPTLEQEAALKRTTAVLNGEIPIVILRGRAKNNPSYEEVLQEYQFRK